MPYYPYNGYYPQMPMPDQLAQLRQGYPQMPMQPVQPPIQRGQDAAIIWVANKQEADNYMVAPNSAVALWDRSAPVIYLKQADASGKPSMTIYDLVERKNAPVQAPQAQMVEYATRADLEAMAARVEAMAARMDAMTVREPAKGKRTKEDMSNAESV